MKKKGSFSLCCVIILFAFAGLMAWHTVSMSSLAAKTEDARQQLEISRGREARQQSEYEKAVQDLPLAKERLEEIKPRTEQAASDTAALKARRKELRAEKKSLQEAAGSSTDQEEKADE